MAHLETTFEVGASAIVTDWDGNPIAEGEVVADSGRYVSLENCKPLNGFDAPSDMIADRKYYALESKEPDDVAVPANPSDSGAEKVARGEPMGPPQAVPPLTMAPPKKKNKLSDDDVERLLMKVGETALNGLKSMGLKSGAIYPLMIKINTAFKAALSNTSKDD